MDLIVYDIETVKAIPPRDGKRLDGVIYCDGWDDHQNMGISVIGVYDWRENRYRVFCQDNFAGFVDLVNSRTWLVGFNNIAFDNKVIEATLGVPISDGRCIDILQELWAAAGLSRRFEYPTHTGFSLDACSDANLGFRKTGNGALSTVDWQAGRIGSVIDYCLNDVMLTARLFKKIIKHGGLIDPRNRNNFLSIDLAWEQ